MVCVLVPGSDGRTCSFFFFVEGECSVALDLARERQNVVQLSFVFEKCQIVVQLLLSLEHVGRSVAFSGK